MSQYRLERLKGQMREELSDIIRGMKDPRIGFVSVTGIELSGDHRHVKAFVSVMGSEEERADTLKVLDNATGFIRSEVGRRIQLRYTPELIFRLDDSIEHGAHINKLLKEIERGER